MDGLVFSFWLKKKVVAHLWHNGKRVFFESFCWGDSHSYISVYCMYMYTHMQIYIYICCT